MQDLLGQALGLLIVGWLVYSWFKAQTPEAKAEQKTARLRQQLREERELEDRLEASTEGWTLPVVVGTYESTDEGRALFSAEARMLGKHGYAPISQSADGGHVHVGRLLMTGGLSVLAGRPGIRSKGGFTVAFSRQSEPR